MKPIAQPTSNMKTAATPRQVNWIQLPDPVRESEVNIYLNWTVDERTEKAIERQAKCMFFELLTAYLHQFIAAVLTCNEEDTIISGDRRSLCQYYGFDEEGMPQECLTLSQRATQPEPLSHGN